MQHLVKQLPCNRYNLTLGGSEKKKNEGSLVYLKRDIGSTENIADINSMCLSWFSAESVIIFEYWCLTKHKAGGDDSTEAFSFLLSAVFPLSTSTLCRPVTKIVPPKIYVDRMAR